MRSINLVLKNLSRRKGRSILNTIGLILAVAVVFSTFTISHSMQFQIGDEVEKYGPNIVVKPDASSVDIPYGSVLIGRSTFPEDYVETIRTIPNSKNLRVVSPKLFGQAQVEDQSLLVLGILPEEEYRLKLWWEVKGSLPSDDSQNALLGSDVASILQLEVGSSFEIKDMTFRVSGILTETGSNDDYAVFVPLGVAQKLLGREGEISIIDVGALCLDCPVEEISRQIMEVLPSVRATPVIQAVETRMKAVDKAASFSLLLASIVLLAGGAGVMNTMVASIYERRREIGVFMSLGADDRYIYKIFLIESLILGTTGGLLGTGLGLLSSVLLGSLALGVPIKIANIPLFVFPLAVALSVSSCLLASLYPTWRATKIDPVSVMKAV
jgi:putative ABC transport system permease protein